MGARQSRRSVDITTTPKKEGIPAEGGDAATPGDGKLERIEETDTKPTTNGIAPHTDVVEDKDKDKDDTTEKDKDKEKPEEVKAEETKQEPAGESPAETAEVTTPTEATPASPNTATSPDSKETKKKEKMKKKWSFRSISFSKKDKNKPAREEAPKNGDVTKEEPLAEGGEEAENGSATAGSPVEEKSAVSSPTAETESAPVAAAAAAAAAPAAETKEESSASAVSSPAEEKAEEPTPSAPTPVPVEEKKEEVEKVEAEKKVVEVSPAGGQFVPEPVEVSVFQVQTVATPSIIERKTSEDNPSLPPSSPPPTPIDSSPSQQAQQAAATVTALAKALNLPAEAADKDSITPAALSSPVSPERDEPPIPAVESLESTLQAPSSSPADEPRTEPTLDALPTAEPALDVLPTVEPPSVIADTEPANPPVVPESFSAGDGDKKPADVVSSLIDDSPSAVVSPYDVPFKPEHSCASSDNETNAERVAPTEILHAAEGGPPMMSFQTRGDECVEVPSEAVAEPMEIVEKSPTSSNTTAVCEKASASSILDETAELAMEPAAIEVTQALVDAKIPEPIDVKEEVEELIEQVAELNEVIQEEIERVEGPGVFLCDRIVVSEEGPMPISDEMVVEAKPAVVIPEDEERTETILGVIPGIGSSILKAPAEASQLPLDVEDKLETESRSFDVTVPTEEILISEEREESENLSFARTETSVDDRVEMPPIDETRVETTKTEEESMPPPLPESPVPSIQEKFDSENVSVEFDSMTSVPSSVVDDAVPQLVHLENTNTVQEFLGSLVQQIETPNEYPVTDSDAIAMPAPPTDDDGPLQTFDSPLPSAYENIACPANESPFRVSLTKLQHVPSPTDEFLSLAPEQTNSQPLAIDDSASSDYYPLPPEDLARLPNVSETKVEVPIPDANLSDARNPTETLLPTPPSSPSPESNVSIASGLTASTKDSSQTQLYDDQSNREFKMESVSISLNSYNESDIELKERLAESLAETEKQEESSVSCQLSNNATSSTTVQETHQNTPEAEVPVENNVTHENSTTESAVETTKVTPPAVPSEVVSVTTSPPSAPAITEDVASVAKAIEEMEISDKAVAAATIECNTNEIIADAHYQNDINE